MPGTIERKTTNGGIIRVTKEPIGKPRPGSTEQQPDEKGDVKKALSDVRDMLREQRTQLVSVELALVKSRRHLRAGRAAHALATIESALTAFAPA